jgi:GxxExxY protein
MVLSLRGDFLVPVLRSCHRADERSQGCAGSPWAVDPCRHGDIHLFVRAGSKRLNLISLLPTRTEVTGGLAEIQDIERIARDVYRTLGSGFSEDVYDRAMQVGLRLAHIKYEDQKVVELKYKNHSVGEGYPDLVVQLGREKIIVELKAISGQIGAPEEQQLKNYLKLLSVSHGLLINFQQPGRTPSKTRLEVKQIAA